VLGVIVTQTLLGAGTATVMSTTTDVDFMLLLLVSPETLTNGKSFTNGVPLLNDTLNALEKTIIWNPEAKSAVPELGTLEPS